MDPHRGQQQERHADVNEHDQGKEAVIQRVGAEKVARQQVGAQRQRLQPLGSGGDAEDGPLVPQQPQAGDAGNPEQP